MDLRYRYPTVENYLAVVREFLVGGGDPNHRDQFQDTLLHIASKIQGSYDVVKELVEAGADVNLANFLRQTPLHVAVMHRNRDVVNALIRFRALVNAKDCLGNSALHYAINACTSMNYALDCMNPNNCPHRVPDMDIIGRLLEHRSVDINVRNSKGCTPLLWAVKDQNVDAVRTLLSKAARVNIGNNVLETPLHAAVKHPNPNIDIATELLLRDARFASFDDSGQTPLDLVLKRVADTESLVFAEIFLRLVAFKYQNNEAINSSLQVNPRLSEFYMRCSEEKHRMRSEIIAGKVSLYDFVLHRMAERNMVAPEFEICKAIVDVLMTGGYPIYFEMILRCMLKWEFYNILRENAVCHRYEGMPRWKAFLDIAALSDEED
ncbi:Putative ankyrin repeat protein FPV245 [Araneus ventricosus]|uniref:Ankyrin repeat protein FPV245 n=1 Tax=Araneus ventricosus TaxID=182803 RepID=A0A4Y2D3G6_ARAVE|nr:Putative ankyrin repeat protein FPV245 [Araneus ventricosus]